MAECSEAIGITGAFRFRASGSTQAPQGVETVRADMRNEEEVRAALEKSGFTILSHEKSDDWSAFAAKK